MGTKEKLIERFRSLPTDFTFDEMEMLLLNLFIIGKTSRTRVIFRNQLGRPIMIHKSHPGNIIKGYAMKQVYNDLKEAGSIK